MKTCLFAILGILCAGHLLAQEIDSEVIQRYSYVSLSFGYVPGHGDLPALAGYQLDGSFEYRNYLAWLNLENFEDTGNAVFGAEMNRTSGGIGYVVRLDRNHINIIPRLGVSYLKINQTDDNNLLGTPTTLVETTAMVPSVMFSYAFNNRFSLDAGYGLGVDVDSGATVSQLNLGATFAFAKRWAVRLAGTLASDQNYNGLFAGVGFHF
jgi:hypothetical protein